MFPLPRAQGRILREEARGILLSGSHLRGALLREIPQGSIPQGESPQSSCFSGVGSSVGRCPGEHFSGVAVLRGHSPQGQLSSGRTCFLFYPSCQVDSSHLPEPDLFLLPHRTGSHTIIYTLMEFQSHMHNSASPQLAMSHLWRKLAPSRNPSRCVKNRARAA